MISKNKLIEKKKKLEELEKRLLNDKKLPLLRSNLVFGEGSIKAQIFFIGEAPGLKEDQLRRPFVGRSGELLTKTLLSIGIKREDVYITNLVKRRPPENRDPSLEEIKKYEPYLKEEIELIDPQIIITLGRLALKHFIPDIKIGQVQGKIFKIDNRVLIPMFHPAFALRGTGNLAKFKKTFDSLPSILGKI